MKKMETWFKLPVNCMPSDVGDWMEHVNFGVQGLSSHHCEAIEDAINNHDKLVDTITNQEKVIDELVSALESLLYVVSDSQGVVGYHLNGDIAEWDEFDEVGVAEQALTKYKHLRSGDE